MPSQQLIKNQIKFLKQKSTKKVKSSQTGRYIRQDWNEWLR